MKKCIKDFVTCGQMKELERRADAAGLSYYQMMENAGTGAAEIIMERYAYAKGSVQIFCGKGNNGGDGFVVARAMCEAGYQVTVILVDGEPKTEDAITNFGLLQALPVRILDMAADDRALLTLKGTPDIIVDAIYGTGFHGSLRSNGLKAAIYINRFSKKGVDAASDQKQTMVAALDIPSGISGDLTEEKELERSSVTAHYTLTFHAKKPVHLQKFAQPLCGEIIVVDIGIDAEKLWHVELEH